MAEVRFPSLEDFHPGTQPDIKDASIENASIEPSADNFLAREKAILGEDASQFTTSQDAAAFGEPVAAVDATVAFKQQFPDITSDVQVLHPLCLADCPFRSTLTFPGTGFRSFCPFCELQLWFPILCGGRRGVRAH